MRIVFANPPRIGRKKRAIEAEDCCWGLGPLVVPSMLLACASEARAAGHDVAFVDLAIEPDAQLRGDIIVHPLAWQWSNLVDDAMRAACAGIDRVVVAVPPGYAQDYAALASKSEGLDDPACVVYAEPEAVIAGFQGSRWRAGVGRCDFNHALGGAPENTMAKLSPIDYALVPEDYWPHYVAAVYQVTRGCPYRCRFCVWGGSVVTDRAFRMRSPEQVAQALGQLREVSGREIPLYLLAAQLTSRMDWIIKFHELMSGARYPFQSNVNLLELSKEDGPERLRLLKEAGLASCSAALDGASDGMLALLGKPADMAQSIQGLLALQEASLLKRVHVRYGVGEGEREVQEACDALDRIKAAGIRRMVVNFAPIIHYKGTEMQECDYPLERLPGRGPERLVMANPPDWSPYVEKLREFKWLGSVGPRK